MKFSQWKYALIAYALKGQMHYEEATKYLKGVIKVQYTGETPSFNVNRDVAQNVMQKTGKNHKGNWYIQTDRAEYQLNCPTDLASRITFVKDAKYSQNNTPVFSENEFNTIIQEFLDKDPSLDRDKILEYCNIKADAAKYNVAPKIEIKPQPEHNPPAVIPDENQYDAEKFLSDVFISREKYHSLVRILRTKKNIILQGAPGVGKTFIAKRLAYSIMGKKDESRVAFVQFHQNYTYEDFVIGYKPEACGFQLKEGIFYQFCNTAADHPDQEYFFIIDEINRGNMSKIFGELLMLIEKDYRGTSLLLAYNGKSFCVPPNLYIIGMMNTADRSLAMIDYALRRRFSFFDIAPGFESEGFKKHQQRLNSPKLDCLVGELQNLNRTISEDKSLGKGFCIGHSYLCGETVCSDEWLQSVVEFDILPMLAEYWFDDQECYDGWAKRLMDAVK